MAVPHDARDPLAALLEDVRQEGRRLLGWWSLHIPDHDNGGFHGEIDNVGRPVPGANRSLVLNARLLWYFSAAHRAYGDARAGQLAERAYHALDEQFRDPDYGGYVWLVSADGRVRDARKQAYGQAFCVYAFAEYHAASGSEEALTKARELQELIEARYWDPVHGGYREALARDWRPIADQRLSARDLDAPKTMNTHLHVMEAYAGLHHHGGTEATARALTRALTVFIDNIYDAAQGHLRLFLGDDWRDLSTAVSFGHDIEASWLISEAAAILSDDRLIAQAAAVSTHLARTTLDEGIGEAGGVYQERDQAGHLDRDGEWWVQAEALVGLAAAYAKTGNNSFQAPLPKLWRFIRAHHLPPAGDAEWSWYPSGSARDNPYLAGAWKCPYHTGRAMIELEHRLGALIQSGDPHIPASMSCS